MRDPLTRRPWPSHHQPGRPPQLPTRSPNHPHSGEQVNATIMGVKLRSKVPTLCSYVAHTASQLMHDPRRGQECRSSSPIATDVREVGAGAPEGPRLPGLRRSGRSDSSRVADTRIHPGQISPSPELLPGQSARLSSVPVVVRVRGHRQGAPGGSGCWCGSLRPDVGRPGLCSRDPSRAAAR